MINDKIYDIRQKEYSKSFIDYINIELENNGLNNTTSDLIKIFQLIELDNLELYLFNKYGVEFIRCLSKLF